MGLLEGKNVKVITCEPAGGPVVIKVDNMKISIGRGLASKVVVSK